MHDYQHFFRNIFHSIQFIRFGTILTSNLKQNHGRFSSSQNPLPINYPYVFGGLKNVEFKASEKFVSVLAFMLGQEIVTGFKQAYRSLVIALGEQDLELIKNTCEHNLYKNMKFQKVKLVNPDAKISYVEGKCFIAIGLNSDRLNSDRLIPNKCWYIYGEKNEKQSEAGSNSSSSYISVDVIRKNQTSTMNEGKRVPFLIGIQLIFKSKMKLVPIENSQDKQNTEQSISEEKQELHSVQFELQFTCQNLSNWTLIKSIFNCIFFRNDFIYKGGINQIIQEILDDNYEWRIGDIDRVLNRNLKIIKESTD